jgi:hypothetical protein
MSQAELLSSPELESCIHDSSKWEQERIAFGDCCLNLYRNTGASTSRFTGAKWWTAVQTKSKWL